MDHPVTDDYVNQPDAAVYPGPAVVPGRRVVHCPGDERVALVVRGVTGPLLLASVAVLTAADCVGPPAPVLLVIVNELVGEGPVAEAYPAERNQRISRTATHPTVKIQSTALAFLKRSQQ